MELHHLAFRTTQIDAVSAFYQEVVGLRVAREAQGRSVWLQAGAAVIMLEVRLPNEPGIPAGSLEFVAFRVSEAEKQALRTRLQTHAVPLESETEHTLYFRDPDGRRIGVSTYPL